MMNFYCSKCGSQLKREERIVPLSDSEAEKQYLMNFRSILHISFPIKLPEEKKEHVLVCPECESEYSIEEQKIYALLQREYGKHVLTSEDYSKNEKLDTLLKNLKKKSIILFLIRLLFGISFFVCAGIFLYKKENYYLMLIPIVFSFILQILNSNAAENKMLHSCLFNISDIRFKMREHISNVIIKQKIIKHINLLLTCAIAPILIICLSINSFCNNNSTEGFIFAIVAICLLAILFVGIRRTVKLGKFINKKIK